MFDFATILAERRKELGLSQGELAKRLHVTRQAVSKWENGKGIPETAMLTKVAEVIGVSVDELLTGKGPEKQIVEKVVTKGKEVVKPMRMREILAIVLPIVLVIVLASVFMGVYIPKAIGVKTIIIQPEQFQYEKVTADDKMFYTFDKDHMEATFKFVPEHSGRYRLYKNWWNWEVADNLEIEVNGAEVTSDNDTAYYDKNDEYIIHIKLLEFRDIDRYLQKELCIAGFELEEVEPPIQLRVIDDEYMFQFYVYETGFYTFETGGLSFILSRYEKYDIKSEIDSIYFLEYGWHTIILEKDAQAPSVNVKFAFNRKDDFRTVTVDKSQEPETVLFSASFFTKTTIYKVDVKDTDTYTLSMLRYASSADFGVWCYFRRPNGGYVSPLTDMKITYDGQVYLEYKFYNLSEGTYYLYVETERGFQGEFTFG